MAVTHVLTQRSDAKRRREAAKAAGESFPEMIDIKTLRRDLLEAGPTPKSSIIDAIIHGGMIKSSANEKIRFLIEGERLIEDQDGNLTVNENPPYPVPGVKY